MVKEKIMLIKAVSKNITDYMDGIVKSTLFVYSNVTLENLLVGNSSNYQTDSYIFSLMKVVASSGVDIYQVYLSVDGMQCAYLLCQNNLDRGTDGYTPPAGDIRPYSVYVEPTHPSHNYDIVQNTVPRKQLVFTIHRPLFRVPSDRQIGWISIDMKITTLDKLSSQLLDEDDKEVYILDQNGKVIFADDTSLIGQTLDEGWTQALRVQQRDTGYFEWQGEQASGVIIYTRLKADSLDWTLVKCIPDAKFYRSARETALVNIGVAMAFLVIAIIVIIIFSYQLTRPIKHLISSIESIQAGFLNTTIANNRSDEIGIIARRLQAMMDTINDLIVKEYKLNMLNRTNQLKILQMQINPHFLNNALQSIGDLALECNAPKVYTLISSLGHMMYYSINMQEELVLLEQEIEYVSNYCHLQLQRFEDKLNISFDIDKETLSVYVPRMIIQPVVENYFKHGFVSSSKRTGILVISSHICEDNLVIVVEDNGRGITSERMAVLRRLLASEELFEQGDGENVGLINVVQRLRFYYGESAGVMLTDCEPQGLKVTLHIPAPTIGEEL